MTKSIVKLHNVNDLQLLEIDIPVKPFVRHFLRKQFGKDPIYLRSDSELGRMLLPVLVSREYMRVTFGRNVGTEESEVLELPVPAGMELVKFEFASRYDNHIVMPEMLEQMSGILESFVRVFLLGFGQGYKVMFYSDHAAAEAFLRLFGFKETELSKDNCHKIIQRGGAIKMPDPMKGKEKRRKSVKWV
jgi:hypothetical protein